MILQYQHLRDLLFESHTAYISLKATVIFVESLPKGDVLIYLLSPAFAVAKHETALFGLQVLLLNSIMLYNE